MQPGECTYRHSPDLSPDMIRWTGVRTHHIQKAKQKFKRGNDVGVDRSLHASRGTKYTVLLDNHVRVSKTKFWGEKHTKKRTQTTLTLSKLYRKLTLSLKKNSHLFQEVGDSSIERAGPFEIRPLLNLSDRMRLTNKYDAHTWIKVINDLEASDWSMSTFLSRKSGTVRELRSSMYNKNNEREGSQCGQLVRGQVLRNLAACWTTLVDIFTCEDL